jgi:hypothetical protein
VFCCSSSGDALTLAHPGSSSHCIVFLATPGTMCHLTLGVWTNILSVYFVYLFTCFVFFFVCLYLFLSIYNFFFFFFFVAMLLIGHNLHYNCGLHIIGVFNVFEHYLSLEISVFDSCVRLERLHLFDRYFTCTLALEFVRYEI